MRALGVRPTDHEPKATQYIPQMIRLVSTLIERGYAYATNGDVYYEVRKFPGYGRLSRRNLDELMAGARVEVDERKRDPLDFALWKAAKPGEPAWDSPWGAGRPGWHIECSAMSTSLLGDEMDIHGGAVDLVFPHHENEIAQSEAATGHTPFVRYWMHGGFLTVERQKMSKSLGNFWTVRDVLAHYPAQVLRFLFLSTHYRQQLEFSDAAMDQARSALSRLEIGRQHLERMASRAETGSQGEGRLAALDAATDAARQAFAEAMDDDFNTPRAIAALFDLVAEAHRLADERFVPDKSQGKSFAAALAALTELAGVLGLTLESQQPPADDLLVRLMRILIDARQQARAVGQYAVADLIRSQLAELGIVLEDRPDGTTWRKS